MSDFTVSIEDPGQSGWDMSKLVISKPSKRTDHRTSKIRYNNECRVILDIPHAVIVRSSSSKGGLFAVYIRVPKAAHELLFDLDEYVIQTTITNKAAWFENVTDDFIRDLYSPCVVYDRKYGGLMKLFVEQGMDEDVDRVKKVSFVLRCLRFNKKSYHLVWQLASVLPPSDDVAWNAVDEEEEEVFPSPVQLSAEDLRVIQGDILDRTDAAECEVRERGAKLAKLLDRVLAVRKKATTKDSAPSLERLEEISSELDLISNDIKQHTFCVA